MSLYLQYRPKTFADLVGQRHIIDILVAQAKNNQLGHSYLLFGPRGTGKTSTARILAKIANCTTTTAEGYPDISNDPQAKLIDENKTLDFVEIDAASHTNVDNIRDEIINKAIYPPAHLKKKVYIIDEVHMLSKSAFNALLKIIEEPPEYLIFILATTELHKVPETIISRCQVFNFKQLPVNDITERLAYIATEEHIPYDPEALRLIAKLSGGAMRDAIKYLEQISILGEVNEAHVATFLGVVSDRLLTQGIELLTGDAPAARISFLDSLMKQGVDLQNFAKELLVRLDDHFMEDPTKYSQLASVLREIIAEAKRYPHPLLIWKAKTRAWFAQKQGTTETISVTKESTPSVKTPVTQSGPIVASLEPQNVQQAAHHTQKKPDTKSDDSPSLTPELIIETLATHATNPLIKSALKQHVLIQEISPETIGAIVINEQFYHTLSKADVTHDLEKLLHTHFAYAGQLKRTYMTKEQRLMRHV